MSSANEIWVTMGVTCLICQDKDIPCHSVNFTAASRPESSILSRHLHIVFILRNVLELPPPKLVKILRSCPNFLEERNIICERCNELVDQCKRIYRELLEVSRKFQNTKLEIVKIMKKFKSESFSNKRDWNDRDTVSGIIKDCRSYVAEHDYGLEKKINPFLEGDVLAWSKVGGHDKARLDSNVMEMACDDVIVKEEVEMVDDVDNDDKGWNANCLGKVAHLLEKSEGSEGADAGSDGGMENSSCDEDRNPDDEYGNTKHESCRGENEEDKVEDDEVEEKESERREEEESDGRNGQERDNVDLKERIKRKSREISFSCPHCKLYRSYWVSKPWRIQRLCYHLDECRHKKNSRSRRIRKISELSCNLCSKYSTSIDDISSFANHLLTCYHRSTSQETKTVQRLFQCSICNQMKTDKRINKYFNFDEYLEHFTFHQWCAYECSQCGEHLLNIDHSHHHWRRKHKELLSAESDFDLTKSPCHVKVQNRSLPVVPWWCSKCGEMFSDESERDNHIQTEHNSLEEVSKDKCDFCEKFYADRDELKLHQFTIHPLESKHLRQCSVCSEVYFKEELLLLHRRRAHSLDLLACEICGNQFICEQNFSEHRLLHQDGLEESIEYCKDLKCVYCDQTFSTRESLIKHITIDHTEMDPFICKVCGKVLPTKQTLIAHASVAHGIGKTKSFPCTVEGCGETFVTRVLRQRHTITVHRNISHKCKVCGKEFKRKRNKERHEIEIHQISGRKYQCDKCSFQTDYDNHFADHQKTSHNPIPKTRKRIAAHKYFATRRPSKRLTKPKKSLTSSSSKPVKRRAPPSCEVDGCPKVFADFLDYRTHMKTHTDAERKRVACKRIQFICPEEGCGKKIWGRKTIEYHMAEFHRNEEPQFACDQCDKKYYRPKALKNHKKNIHRICPEKSTTFLWRNSEKKTCEVEGCPGNSEKGERLCSHIQDEIRGIQSEDSTIGTIGITTESKGQSVCNICGKSVSKGYLSLHKGKDATCKLLLETEKKASLDCHICGKTMSSKNNLDKHIRYRHEGRFPFHCDQCGKGFISNPLGELHLALVHKIGNVQREKATCHICGKTVSNKFYLERHILERHEGKFSFYCEHCGKGFEATSRLKRHLAVVHKIGEFHQKKYLCPWEGCGLMHKNKSWVEYCAARHRKEEPRFKCDQCEKGFYFPQYLSQHKSVVHRGYRIPAKRSTTKVDETI